MNTSPRVIVALDFPVVELARHFVGRLDPKLCRLKVGITLFTQEGPAFVEELMKQGFDVFLDLKFHDIPMQVAGACKVAAEIGVWMMNVHTLGGKEMMLAAHEAIATYSPRPILLGVTILTSSTEEDLIPVGIEHPIKSLVPQLAKLAQRSGLDGVVCSSQEALLLRETLDHSFILVTPGIRLPDDQADDQKRILTPKAAVRAGADYLVIGRPITQAADPIAVLEKINHEISES